MRPLAKPLFPFLLLLLPAAAFGQAADPFDSRLGIDAVAHEPGRSLTAHVSYFDDVEQTSAGSSFGSQTWDFHAGSPPSDNTMAGNPRLFAKLEPGRNYYVTALLSGGSASDRTVELNFDVPRGHSLLVDDAETTHVKGELFETDLRRSWVVQLVRDGFELPLDAAENSSPYLGDEYVFDIGLGRLARENAAGLIRFRREKVAAGEVSPAMLYVESMFLEVERIFNGATIRQVGTPDIVADILPKPDPADGFTIDFYSQSQASRPGTFYQFTGSPFASYDVGPYASGSASGVAIERDFGDNDRSYQILHETLSGGGGPTVVTLTDSSGSNSGHRHLADGRLPAGAFRNRLPPLGLPARGRRGRRLLLQGPRPGRLLRRRRRLRLA